MSLEELLKNFSKTNWIYFYIFWELNLLKELGFDPYLDQFKKINLNEKTETNTTEIDNVKYQVPNFLINKNLPNILKYEDILLGLSFTRNLLVNKFFIPNNLIFPKSRIILENYFN